MKRVYAYAIRKNNKYELCASDLFDKSTVITVDHKNVFDKNSKKLWEYFHKQLKSIKKDSNSEDFYINGKLTNIVYGSGLSVDELNQTFTDQQCEDDIKNIVNSLNPSGNANTDIQNLFKNLGAIQGKYSQDQITRVGQAMTQKIKSMIPGSPLTKPNLNISKQDYEKEFYIDRLVANLHTSEFWNGRQLLNIDPKQVDKLTDKLDNFFINYLKNGLTLKIDNILISGNSILDCIERYYQTLPGFSKLMWEMEKNQKTPDYFVIDKINQLSGVKSITDQYGNSYMSLDVLNLPEYMECQVKTDYAPRKFNLIQASRDHANKFRIDFSNAYSKDKNLDKYKFMTDWLNKHPGPYDLIQEIVDKYNPNEEKNEEEK